MRTLKLVGAKRYNGKRTGNKQIEKGQTFDFSDEDAEALLKETVRDLSNNDLPLFVEVAGAGRSKAKVVKAVDDEEEAPAVAPRRRTRAARAAATA